MRQVRPNHWRCEAAVRTRTEIISLVLVNNLSKRKLQKLAGNVTGRQQSPLNRITSRITTKRGKATTFLENPEVLPLQSRCRSVFRHNVYLLVGWSNEGVRTVRGEFNSHRLPRLDADDKEVA